ncbi:MAG TPA: vanadium-dependent haloperoxidase [Candidatus Saccharimonadales bacterium]|nr:vanadium-dependent haloperoxidase [Candidatus Saccharimonadales bacterium]
MHLSTQQSRATRWRSTTMAIALVAGTILAPAASVVAAEPSDMVLRWNSNAIAAIGNLPTATPPGLGQPPPLAPIHLAMVHGAIYDAVQAIVETHEPYLGGLDAPSSASKAAAVAAAARGVLVGLATASPTVTDSVNALYDASLLEIPDGAAETAGVAVGAAAAAAMLADRAGDGRFGTTTFDVGDDPGEWRLVPPLNANSFHWVGDVRPFTLERPDQYRIGAPFPLSSPEYAAEFNEVKSLGGATSTRTPAQAELASFSSVNPFPMVNRGLREIAAARGLSVSQQARLFVMTTMSAADSAIACWENKDHWNFWRPQTAIQLAGSDGNPATVADPGWTSLIPSPGYPDPPSGFNCLVSGTMNGARAYFGTNRMTFDLTSIGAAPVTRHYKQFSGPIKDAIDGRVYVGLHFRRADEQGAWLGMKVAKWLDSHYFAAID